LGAADLGQAAQGEGRIVGTDLDRLAAELEELADGVAGVLLLDQLSEAQLARLGHSPGPASRCLGALVSASASHLEPKVGRPRSQYRNFAKRPRRLPWRRILLAKGCGPGGEAPY